MASFFSQKQPQSLLQQEFNRVPMKRPSENDRPGSTKKVRKGLILPDSIRPPQEDDTVALAMEIAGITPKKQPSRQNAGNISYCEDLENASDDERLITERKLEAAGFIASDEDDYDPFAD